MSSIPLPALAVRPPEQQDPTQNMLRTVQLASMLKAQPVQQQILQQQAQAGAMENQQRAMQLRQAQALADLFAGKQQQQGTDQGQGSNALPGPKPPVNAQIPGQQQQGTGNREQGTDAKTQPTYAPPTEEEMLAAGGPSALPIIKSMAEFKKVRADLQKVQNENQAAALDYMGNVANAIKASGYNMETARTMLQHLAGSGFENEAAQMWSQIQQNPAALQQITDRVIAMSPKQRELAAQETVAGARKLAARYKVVDGTLMDMSGSSPRPAMTEEMSPQGWNNLVDKVVPPSDVNAALNSRTKGEVAFYVQRGNVGKAADAITRAGQQIGTIKKEIPTTGTSSQVVKLVNGMTATFRDAASAAAFRRDHPDKVAQ